MSVCLYYKDEQLRQTKTKNGEAVLISAVLPTDRADISLPADASTAVPNSSQSVELTFSVSLSFLYSLKI